MLVRPDKQAASKAQLPLGSEKLFLSLVHKVKVMVSNNKGYPDTILFHCSFQGLEAFGPLVSRADK